MKHILICISLYTAKVFAAKIFNDSELDYINVRNDLNTFLIRDDEINAVELTEMRNKKSGEQVFSGYESDVESVDSDESYVFVELDDEECEDEDSGQEYESSGQEYENSGSEELNSYKEIFGPLYRPDYSYV